MTHNTQPRSNRFSRFLASLPPAKSRMLRRNLLFVGITLAVIGTLSLISRANAAGGAYAVDDGALNAPGECTLDAWYKSRRQDSAHHEQVLSPACTLASLPWVQWGAELARHRADGTGETQLSPQIKTQLLNREDLGLQLALATSVHFAFSRSHAFDGADISLPLTYQPLERLRATLSGGWTHAYDNGDQQHRWTWGTALEYDLAEHLTLIAERFGQQGGEQGWQAGPRLHLGQHLDLDLILGQHLDTDRDRWLSTGATLRF